MADSSLTREVPENLAIPPLQDEAALPEALQTPTQSLGIVFRIFFALASLVTGLCNVTIKQLLLPTQVANLDPHNKFTTLALIASIGALAGVITAPVSGALSDRTTLRWGRRRPWLLFGIVVGFIGLILMAQATTVLQLLIGEIIVQIALDTIMSAITALIPDKVPPHQRATASAFIGMSPIVGGLVGLVLVTRFAKTTAQSYYILAGVTVVLVLLFFFVLREKPLPRGALPAFNLKTFLAEFWVNPRKYPDFGYTFFSRCLIFLGYTILISYILFYLQDVIHYANPNNAVTIFQLLSTGSLIIAAIIGGIVADKLRRLKPFVSGAAIVMGAGLLLIALVPAWPVMLVGAVILGIGFGVYLAVDIALAVRVLPAATNRGKDLGIINTAIFLPLILSPLIGAVVLNTFHNNYALLFTLSAIFILLAGVLVLPIKSVR